MELDELTKLTKRPGKPGRPRKIDLWDRKNPTLKVSILWDRLVTDHKFLTEEYEQIVLKTADDREDAKMALQRMATTIDQLVTNLNNMKLVLMYKHPEPLRIL